MEFFKYHGAGNDFILMKDLDGYSIEALAQALCHRRFGVGADGLMIPEPSAIADIKMVYHNSDGSYATMCGNGLRCFSKFVYEEGLVGQETFTVETGDGIKRVSLTIEEGKVEAVKVKMSDGKKDLAHHQFQFEDRVYQGTYLNLGVPHLVVPVEGLTEKEIVTYGPKIEKAPVFENGTNVNFVRVVDSKEIHVDTWERGAGYTYACGTGCCASVYALYVSGEIDSTVSVVVKGGKLEIEVLPDGSVMMTGPAIKICKGNYLAPIEG
jgi:diaminopimelate epimerase